MAVAFHGPASVLDGGSQRLTPPRRGELRRNEHPWKDYPREGGTNRVKSTLVERARSGRFGRNLAQYNHSSVNLTCLETRTIRLVSLGAAGVSLPGLSDTRLRANEHKRILEYTAGIARSELLNCF